MVPPCYTDIGSGHWIDVLKVFVEMPFCVMDVNKFWTEKVREKLETWVMGAIGDKRDGSD